MGNVDKLIKKLTDQKAETRKMAIIELGKLKDPMAVEPIIIRLKDDDEEVRLWAAATLGKFADERALEPLVKVVMTDNIERIRKEAAGSVVKIVPSFDDVNIDVVIQKIESIYEEFKIDKERDAQKTTIQMELDKEKERKKEADIKEKYFEQLQEIQKESEIEAQPPTIPAITPTQPKIMAPPAMAIPTTRPIAEGVNIEDLKEKKEEVKAKEEGPEVGIADFMKALKKGTVEERIDELSDVLSSAMNLFVTAIDDISMRLTNLENKIEQSNKAYEYQASEIPTMVPTFPEMTNQPTKTIAPPPKTVLPTRAALNEELKKVLSSRKIED